MRTTAAPMLSGIVLFLAVSALAAEKADAPEKALAALEQKMVGEWKGRIACDGRLIFKADGTYELKQYGPAPSDSAGTWKVRWDALPPTLVLTCKTSENADEVGTSLKVKLLELDDRGLAFKYASQKVGHYTRVKK